MAAANDLAAVLGRAGQYFNDARPLLPMYAHLVLSALFPIYVGAHASLFRPSSAAKPKKKAQPKDGEEEEEDTVQKMEGLSNRDAIILPITAGLMLGTLYFLIKKYGADVINLVMGVYFAFVGVFSVAQFVNDTTNVLVGLAFPTYFRHRGALVRVSPSERKAIRHNQSSSSGEHAETTKPVPWLSSRLPAWLLNRIWDIRQLLKQKFAVKAFIRKLFELDINLTLVNVFSALAGLGTTIYVSTVSRTWFLTNLQGFAVSYSALQLLSPTTFATGSLILAALFCYDIWAVFFTPLMIAVATNLDQPIKLVFPKPDEPSPTPGEPPVKSYSMLGLGDIVVPGLMIGLALRFDLYMFYLKKQHKRSSKHSLPSSSASKGSVQKAPYVPVTGRWGDRFWTSLLRTSSLPSNLHTSFPKPYFAAAMTGYVAGMLTTLGVMRVFHHAQPALLYLVPGVLISLWGTALVRGEVREMWEFSEGIDASQVEPDAKAEGDSKKVEEKNSQKGLFERIWAEIRGIMGSSGKDDGSKETGEVKTASTPKSPKKSGNAKSKKGGEDADKSESVGQKNLLFSFSIALFDPKSTGAVDQAAKSRDVKSSTSKQSPTAASDSSDDAIVVSSADLDGVHDADSTPRYRTRSMRGVSRGRA